MHIILGMLGSIVTILYFLDRLGVDIGWLNPWSWARRRRWAKKYEGDPIHSVDDPIGIAAILIVGSAQLDGDLTAEQKQSFLELFSERFSLSSKAASDLLVSTTHLFGAPQVIRSQLDGVLERNKQTFNGDQASSLIEMVETAATMDGPLSESQREYIDGLRSNLAQPKQEGEWA